MSGISLVKQFHEEFSLRPFAEMTAAMLQENGWTVRLEQAPDGESWLVTGTKVVHLKSTVGLCPEPWRN